MGYNYNPYESDYENDDNHGSYAGNGPYEPINGGSLSMNKSISTTQSLQLTTSYYFYSFDNKLMAEYDETGACIREYIYMGDRLIAEYLPQSNQYYYYTTDHINSTHMVTDDNGEMVYYTLFGPYGERIIPLEQVTTYDPQLKFSGKEREPEAEIDYFGARYYDHNSYRFISVDPIINKEEALSNPQFWNLYSYCNNNPITYHDPDGKRLGIDKSLAGVLENALGIKLKFNKRNTRIVEGFEIKDKRFNALQNMLEEIIKAPELIDVSDRTGTKLHPVSDFILEYSGGVLPLLELDNRCPIHSEQG